MADLPQDSTTSSFILFLHENTEYLHQLQHALIQLKFIINYPRLAVFNSIHKL